MLCSCFERQHISLLYNFTLVTDGKHPCYLNHELCSCNWKIRKLRSLKTIRSGNFKMVMVFIHKKTIGKELNELHSSHNFIMLGLSFLLEEKKHNIQ